MRFQEKLYALRKKSGLSQEQLAEALGVSRQAISKWESGTAMPESDKLIAISEYFHVTVDHLLRGEGNGSETDAGAEGGLPKGDAPLRYGGLALCVLGFLALIVWGVLMVADPSVSEDIAASSAVVIDGRGILLIACFALVAIGVFLLVRRTRR